MNTIKLKNTIRVALIAFLFCTTANFLHAADYLWAPVAASTAWASAANWSPNGIPGSGDRAIIGNIAVRPHITTSVTIDILAVRTSGVLYIDGPNGSLTVDNAGDSSVTIGNNGQLNLSGAATLLIKGTISGLGTLDAGSGASVITIRGDMTVSSFQQGDFNSGATSKVIMDGTSAQSMIPPGGSYSFNNLEVDNGTANGVTLIGDIEIDIDLTGSGTLTVENNATPHLVTLVGNMTITGYAANNSELDLSGGPVPTVPQAQSINGHTFYKVVNNNTNTTVSSGNVTINNNLDFQGGKFILGTNNLTMGSSATITSYDKTKYVVTNGGSTNYTTGFLSQRVAAADSTFFPIGPSITAYNPITIKPTGTTTDYKAKVLDAILDGSGSSVTDNAVNKTWLVKQSSGSTVSTQAKLQWSSSSPNQEMGTFSHTAAFISQRTSQDFSGGSVPWIPTQTAVGSFDQTGNAWSHLSGSVSMVSGTDYFLATGSSGSPLPVTWLSFNGAYKEGAVILGWKTATEINNSHFEVQRSSDARNWTTVGQVAGNGNSNTLQTYSYKDNSVNTETPSVVYYRLKQVDYNGQYEYSIIRSVAIAGYTVLADAYPNPVKNILNITLHNASAGSTVRLTNIEGVTVYSATLTGGPAKLQADITSLPAGIYYLQVPGAKGQTLYKN